MVPKFTEMVTKIILMITNFANTVPKLMNWYHFNLKLKFIKKINRCVNRYINLSPYQYKHDKYKIVI